MTGRRKMIIGWTVFLVGGGVMQLIIFSIMESWGLTHDDAITLSRFVWEVSQAWPPIVPIFWFNFGGIIYGFIVHIWWRWDPRNPNDRGG